MIKKATGIATILLLILGIAIGIAKADAKKVQLHNYDNKALATKDHRDVDLYLSKLDVFAADHELVKEVLSASAKKYSVKPFTLFDAKLEKKDSVELTDDFGLLALKG